MQKEVFKRKLRVCGLVALGLFLSPVSMNAQCSTGDPALATGSLGCVNFSYRGQPQAYTTVRAADGNIWLQQNLGAAQVGAFQADTAAYGDVFQWGRWDDGHQLRNATVSAAAPVPNNPSGLGGGTALFYTGNPAWWDGGALTHTWAGATPADANDTNGCDPCKALGAGWHLPSQAEWMTVLSSENIGSPAQAFNSNLKLVTAGYRNTSGAYQFVGVRGYYWSSTPSATGGKYLYYSGAITNPSAGGLRGQGASLRCLKSSPPVPDSVDVHTLNNAPAQIHTSSGLLQLQADVYPAGVSQAVTWSIVPVTGNAGITSSGMVNALGNGTVWARAASVADTLVKDSLLITITGQIVPVDSVVVRTLNNVPAVIGAGNGSLQMVAKVYPAAASQSVTWSIVPLTGNAAIGASGLVTPLGKGTVWAKAVSVQNAAKKDSVLVQINIPAAGIAVTEPSPELHVYPNPARNVLVLQLGRRHSACRLTISDAAGRVLLRRELKADAVLQPLGIELPAAAPGVYFLHLGNEQFNLYSRFSKQ